MRIRPAISLSTMLRAACCEAIITERMSRDDRLTLIRNTDCPESWAGKCHAARIGAEHADGEWIAFIDADTWADPDLIRAAMGEAQRRDTALLDALVHVLMARDAIRQLGSVSREGVV